MKSFDNLRRPARQRPLSQPAVRLPPAFACIASMVIGTAYAAPQGELDGGFGESGRLTIGLGHFFSHDDSVGWAIAQSPSDGKTLVAGSALDPTSFDFDFVVLKLNSDGSTDRSFGVNGVAAIDFDDSDDRATAISIQADGRILVTGHSSGVSLESGWEQDLALARLNSDGTFDTSFGRGGRVTRDLGGPVDTAAGIELLSDGRFIVAGTSDAGGTFDVVFARFEGDGSPDASFGTSVIAGVTFIDVAGRHDMSFSMTQQPDGKLIGCGQSGPNPTDAEGAELLAIRVNADGTVDESFGSSGISLLATGSTLGSGQGCVLTPDGMIVLAGFGGEAGSENVVLARLTPNGAGDPTFGAAGLAQIDLGGAETASTIFRLTNGDLAIVGTTAALVDGAYPQGWPSFRITLPSEFPSEMFFARIDADSGSIDTEFGNGGVTIVDFGVDNQPSWAYGRAAILQADGKLLAVGTAFRVDESASFFAAEYPSIALARVELDGNGSAGRVGFDFGSGYTNFDSAFARVEPGAEIVVGVRRTGGSSGPISVDYETVEYSARAPRDFTQAAGTLAWASGETGLKFITVAVSDEAAGDFYIDLKSSSTSILAASRFRVHVNSEKVRPPPPPIDPIAGAGGGGGASGAWLLLLLATCAAAVRFGEGRRCRTGSV